MLERKDPRKRPARLKRLFFDYEVEDVETFQFKLPSPMITARIIALLGDTSFVRGMQKALVLDNGKGLTKEEIKTKATAQVIKELGDIKAVELLDVSESVTRLSSAAVGQAWFHDKYDLEASLDKHDGDYEAYGQAVFDELYEEFGLNSDEFNSLSQAVTIKIKMASLPKAARERMDFSKRRSGGTN